MMTRDTCCTSMPRDHTSVVISTRLEKRERERERERERWQEAGGRREFTTKTSSRGSPVPSPELLHDGVSLFLRHVSVHGGNGEISLSHLLCQPFNLHTGWQAAVRGREVKVWRTRGRECTSRNEP